MSEDHNVSMIGEEWGRSVHRSMRVDRCSNGYTVKYKCKAIAESKHFSDMVEVTRVFITNADMLEFVEKYFEGEPKP